MQNSLTLLLSYRQGGSILRQTSCMMFSQCLKRTWLIVLFWNSVCSQLLYEYNNQWNNEFVRDSKEASTQLLQERLEALLKETKLESELRRSRHETLSESYKKLPKVCKEHVYNGTFRNFYLKVWYKYTYISLQKICIYMYPVQNLKCT